MKNIKPSESNTQDPGHPPSKKKARPGLEFMRDRSSHQVGISKEMDNYFSLPRISNDEDVLGFWKCNERKYPTLTKLATIYLAIPASSAPVEKIFSIGEKIFRHDRCRLTCNSDLFQTLMFIR